MRLSETLGLGGLLVLLASGCAGGGAATKAAESPAPGDEGAEDGQAEGAKASKEKKDEGPRADVLYSALKAVPAPGDACEKGEALPAQSACKEARPELAEALALEGDARDEALVKLESCAEFPPGLVRALRAELGEAACADSLLLAVVSEGVDTSKIPADIRETLVALALGARLRRLAEDAPVAPDDHKKEALQEYFEKDLFPWVSSQAQAIFSMASQGTHLSGYARGVVAIEAGNADMRFVEIVRDAPIADEFASDQEAKDLYYATLDERLETRKARGRNAALVGLYEMARAGVRTSARVSEARALLSRAYGGRRINALDALLLADVPPQKAETDAAAIASRVPTSYASILIGRNEASANLARAHLQMGMSLGMRREIESSGDAVSRLLLARAVFESGRTYFRSEDFQAVHAQLTSLLDGNSGSDPLSAEQIEEARLLQALSVALVAGPKNATELIANGPRFADALGNLVLLDRLGEEKSELGGRAAFNAAYLRELVAPSGEPEFWKDLAARYQAASRQLKGDEKRLARDRAKACRDIEKTLSKQARKK